ncbi:AAA family ATPase [Rouxiella chamberiensis]|uniref:AAA family ATPase n=1 Tax=Rouxiella chamberiensis TaxID=1513468 RepID=UPI0005D347A9|nr:AAA family ATPase [Rouxiella chamberiensis]
MNDIYISRVQIEGGFLDGLDVSLKHGLNTIIGARGTGKSTFIELIRYCLDVKGHTIESNNKAISHAKSVLNDGQITVTICNGSDSFSYTRTGDSEPTPPIDRNLKTPLIFSQTEIENVGLTSSGRMKLIDDFLSGLDTLHQQEFAEIAIVESYASEILSLSSSVDDVEDKLLMLPQLRQQMILIELEEKKIAGISEVAKLKSDDLKKLSDVYFKLNENVEKNNKKIEKISSLKRNLNSFMAEKQEVESWVSSEVSSDARIVNELKIAGGHISSIISAFDSFMHDISIELNELQVKIQDITKQGQGLRSDIDKIQEGAGEVARKRQTLQQSILNLENIKKLNFDKSIKVLDLKNKRDLSLTRLCDLRKQRSDLRVAKCNDLNKALKPKIKVTIEVANRLDDYQQVLINALKGGGIRYNDIAPIISESIPPVILIKILESNDIDGFISLVSISKDRALKIINSLKQATDKIATVLLEDEIKLELLDGSEYKDFTALSTGQRCTVILPIILEHKESILVVDQPEDHIDNAFIVETLISSITRRANDGQIIVSSHNANVPVLGGAETVIHLNSDGTRGYVIAEGGLDDINIVSSISNVMEGGREAFNRRADFYGR